QPGQADIQSDLFYDYRTNVEAYPEWQAWMREKQPRLLVIWGKHDLSFDLGEPERYRKDVPKAEVHVLDAGHFALDTAADQIVQLVRDCMKEQYEGKLICPKQLNITHADFWASLKRTTLSIFSSLSTRTDKWQIKLDRTATCRATSHTWDLRTQRESE